MLYVCSIRTKIPGGLFSVITVCLALSVAYRLGAVELRACSKASVRCHPDSSWYSISHLDSAILNAYSSEPWPDWGVPPGNLTPRGSKLMTLFGSYYRLYFADSGLLRSSGCEDAAQVDSVADAEPRTCSRNCHGRRHDAGLQPERA